MKAKVLFILCCLLQISYVVNAQIVSPPYKNIMIDSTYEHTKWGISPSDSLYHFAAYTTSFDSDDDDNNDGTPDKWGIPEWVAYEVKKHEGPDPTSSRPSSWLTDKDLNMIGVAPNDATYHVRGTQDMKEVSGNSRYVRGHMCPKDAAERVSSDAAFNTHTVLNAVPQLQWQNNEVWKYLEEDITEWADKYERIWVICGPVFFNKTPAVWLGQNEEVKAAVPDALFKILIREATNSTGVETLTFLIPNVNPNDKDLYAEFLVSIDRIEEVTGLTFLTEMEISIQIEEKAKNKDLTMSQKLIVVEGWE